ncbi:sensor histidine kinase [Streptomyces hainanensis]|uniref:ATP-binding protein n=1 Tax=Streptomyces hainanensis TaxID=402648 RepID=A0A4R4TH56_9ACTN|nr:hypothetical protein [Streptomyces hainanensis]TDC74552.1 hypothetical protein E1283_15300 [Streptomyces hainanensis]
MGMRAGILVRLAFSLVFVFIAGFGAGPLAFEYVGVVFVWNVVFAWVVWRNPGPVFIAADVAVVALICSTPVPTTGDLLHQGEAVAWVLPPACGGLLVAQLGLRRLPGLLAAVLIALVTGSGQPGGAELMALPVLQGALTAVLLTLRATPDGQRPEHHRLLHDTGLATVTMIATGAVAEGSPVLRRRAAADLVALDTGARPGEPREPGDATGPARLDAALRSLNGARLPGLAELDLRFDVEAIVLPSSVVTAMADSAAEALVNVARHSGGELAWVRASQRGGVVVVEIRDRGRGAELDLVLPHRRGLRESIVGRMRAIGGDATVITAPAAGTRVLLRWTRD